MAKSMTAYGRSSLVKEDEIWTLEIFSVNKRNLEFFINLPKDYLFLDTLLRKKLSVLVSRGQITLRLSRQINVFAKTLSSSLLDQLESLKAKWNTAAIKLGFAPEKEISLKFLLENLSDYDFLTEDYREKFVSTILDSLFDDAYKKYEMMKVSEGKVLADDIKKRIQLLKDLVARLELECQQLPEKYKKKLQERLKSLSEVEEGIEERAARELAFMVEKMDVTEELVRFNSHLDQMADLLVSKEKSIGKSFDFLLQEAFRELNTLGNKALDLSPIKLTLEMKSELEKIREQIQNIE